LDPVHLGDLSLEHLNLGHVVAVPGALDAHGQDPAVVEARAEATAHAAMPERPVGRVEVEVAMKAQLSGPGPEAERKGRRRELSDPLRRRDARAIVGGKVTQKEKPARR
jgi:hypothetical protein